MELKFHKSSSGVSPELLDTTSSQFVNYIRKNVVEKKVKMNPDSDEEQTMYEYDEAKLTKDEYNVYETGTDAQLAIAELAETVLDNQTMIEEAIAELAEAMLS